MSKKEELEDQVEETEETLSGDEEGTVDWDAAEEFMNGKEEEEEEEESDDDDLDFEDEEEDGELDTQDPEVVPVRLKGHTIHMTAAQAAAFEEYRRENRERDGRLGGELSQSKERIARLEALAEERERLAREQLDDGPKMPAPEEAIRDFPTWQKKFQEYQQFEQAKLLSTLEKKHLAERQAEQEALVATQRHTAWANAFYADNPHLNKPVLKPIVATVFEENEREMASYGDDYGRAFKRLAELTDARMAEIMSVRKTNPNRAPALETSQNRTVKKKPKKPAKPFTLSDWSDKKRAESSTR